jgi:hypothetical protein
MATATPHERYVQILMERVKQDTYPSGTDMDRIEQFITTPDELTEYLEFLFENLEKSPRPKSQMKARIERILSLAMPHQD